MPAHARALKTNCDVDNCAMRAVVEVFNTWNDRVGRYCRKHGDEKVAELRRVEEMSAGRKWVSTRRDITKTY